MMRWRILLAALLVTACIPKSERAVERPPSPAPIPADRALLQCRADLARDGVGFRALPDRVFDNGCTAIGAVQLLEIGTPVTNLGAMTCPLARAFARWTRDAVQPAARQWLGSQVVRIESMGSYACRPVNGQAGKKLSEHGYANAVDIGAFVLADGRRVAVLGGWTGDDANVRGFLRAVHAGGCSRFQIGLGPDANAFHANHMHFDMGRGPYCR